jgi:hypothetical protein
MSVADDTTRNARGDDLGGSPVGIAPPLICTACSLAEVS